MECTKYKLLQYVGKAKTGLIIRLSGHHKDVLKLNAIPANQHLAQLDHDFDINARFTIIEQF